MSHTASPFAVVVRFTVREGREAEFDDLVSAPPRGCSGLLDHDRCTPCAWSDLRLRSRHFSSVPGRFAVMCPRCKGVCPMSEPTYGMTGAVNPSTATTEAIPAGQLDWRTFLR